MTRLIGAVMVVALLVSVAPAVAGDSFQALHQLSPKVQATLTPLTDEQLATVQGAQGIPLDFFYNLNLSGFFLLMI